MVARFLSMISLVFVLSVVWPVYVFCRSHARTALRSTARWTAALVALWSIASALALVEPSPGAWHWLGLIRLGACAMLLAPIVALLGAVRPRELIWNFIVISLLVVFSLPILEQSVLGKELVPGQVGLDGPRAALFCTIALVGIANYLPTRLAVPAILFGVGAVVEMMAIGPWPMDADRANWWHGIAGLFLGAAGWSAWWIRPKSAAADLERAWHRMRHEWGMIWSIRVRDRWNAVARQHQWNLELDRHGPRAANDSEPVTAENRLRGERYLWRLLRRFLDSMK